MNILDTSWGNFIDVQRSSPWGWILRGFALVFGVRFAWATFARERTSGIEANASKRPLAGRIVQLLLAVALFLVALGVLK